MKNVWKNEPVMVLGVILAVVVIVLIVFTEVSNERLAAVVTLATLATSLLARSQVTPVSKVE